MIDGRLDDGEWALCAGFVIETGTKRGRPPRYGNWSSVYRQFLRWAVAGQWLLLNEAAKAAGGAELEAALAAVCALPGRRKAR
ncbi:hypothetical protein MSC49_32530 [Methylosinus sp. C49]|uniref:transposase n=1 Tax=Methylosinus sp. C49 TaxID=2699395 RepID=UPI001366B769|nr:transposase [Methylosinus sp. C49]BBU63318.1 hypothetical protein MSC49_32530 [Methylosinus sp. C49]